MTNGDVAGELLARSGLPGEILVWRDVLYDGPRNPGWPDDDAIRARARFLAQATGGGLSEDVILGGHKDRYRRLAAAADHERIVLWFDACLFDQAMLAHLLACLRFKGAQRVDLLRVDAFPGIEPFNGLGQLSEEQLASLYENRQPVTAEQYDFAEVVDRAFALQDTAALARLSELESAPLPWLPPAVARWLLEQPDAESGLGRLEQLAVDAVRAGCATPGKIFSTVSTNDTHPQFWGDTTLWAKINSLADHQPPLVRIDGPEPRLPQWPGGTDLTRFRITGLPA